MIFMPIILLAITNLFTAWVIKNKYQNMVKQAVEETIRENSEAEAAKKENQTLKQEMADIRYRNKELEKDLAASQRQSD